MSKSRTQSKLYGADELVKVLKQLPAALGVKALDAANRKGAKVIKDAAEQAFNKPKQFLVKKDKNGKGVSNYRIGPNEDNWHLIFKEFGTKPHKIKSDGVLINSKNNEFYGLEINHPGVMADPIFRGVFEAKKEEAARAMMEHLGKTVEKAAIKLSNKYRDSGLVKRKRRR